jgi:hypothetical protein
MAVFSSGESTLILFDAGRHVFCRTIRFTRIRIHKKTSRPLTMCTRSSTPDSRPRCCNGGITFVPCACPTALRLLRLLLLLLSFAGRLPHKIARTYGRRRYAWDSASVDPRRPSLPLLPSSNTQSHTFDNESFAAGTFIFIKRGQSQEFEIEP